MTRLRAIAALAAAAVLVLLASLYLTLQSSRFESWLRARLIARLEQLIGAPASLATIEVHPLRLTAEATGLELSVDRVRFRAEHLRVVLDRRALLGGGAEIAELGLDGAVLDLDLGHGLDLAARFPAGDSTAVLPRRIRLGHVALNLSHEAVTVRLGELGGVVDLDRATREIAADLAGTVERLTWHGRELGPGAIRARLAGGRNRPIAIESITGTLRPGQFDLAGAITLAPPELDLQATATLETAIVSRLVGKPGAASGPVRFSGRIAGSAASPRATGRIEAASLRVPGGIEIDQLEGDVVASARGAALLDGSASVYGGHAAFRAEVPFADPEAVVRFQLDDSDLGRMHDRLPPVPFLAGEASGSGRITFPYAPGAAARIEASVHLAEAEPVLRSRTDDPRLRLLLAPLTGDATLTYQSRVIEALDARLSNPFAEFTGGGRFTLGGPIDAAFHANAAEVGELATLEGLSLPWLPAPARCRVTGPLAAAVTWTGTAAEPVLAVQGSVSPARIEGPAYPGAASVPLGAVEFTLELADHALGWTAGAAGERKLAAHGTTELREGQPSHHAVHVESPGLPTADALELLGLSLPAQGSLAFGLDLVGDRTALTGEIRATHRGQLLGRPVERADLAFSFSPRGIDLSRFEARTGGGSLRASGTLGAGGGALDLAVSGEGLDLATLFAGSPVPVAGELCLDGELHGTLEAPHGSGDLEIRGLRLRAVDLGDLSGPISGGRDEIEVRLARAGEAGLDASLRLRPRPPYRYRIDADFTRLALAAPANTFGGGSPEVRGEATGTLVLAGELAERRLDRARLSLAAAHLEVGGIGVRSTTPWNLSLHRDGRKLEVSGLTLEGEESRLAVAGTVGLFGDTTDLSVKGHTDLRLLLAFLPDVALSGPVDVALAVRGAGDDLGLHGTADLTAGYFRTKNVPFPLRDASAHADFSGRRGTLTNLTARYGGGTIHASGEIDLAAAGGAKLTLNVGGEDVRFRLSEDLEVRADPELRYEIAAGHRQLSGNLAVTRATYRPRGGLGAASVSPGLAFAGGSILPGFGDTRLDLTVVAENNLWLLSEDARLEADAHLTIQGTTADPVILGSIRYVSQEKLLIRGRRYRVQRGTLVFDNPFRVEPRLDLEAGTELSGYNIVLRISGPLSSPRVEASSDPPLPQNDVLSLLAGGQARQGFGVAAPAGESEILSSLLLPGAFGRLSGGRVTVDPLVLNGKADPTQVLPITIQPAEDFDFTVGLPLNGTEQSLIIFNWRPFRNYTFSISRDLNRAYGAEAIHERRFGGPPAARRSGPLVTEVGVSGLEGAGAPDAAAAREQLSVRPGRRLDREQMRQDIERLDAWLRDQGRPLAQVSAASELGDDGESARVAYSIALGPEVQISLTGAKPPHQLRSRIDETVQSFGLYGETLGEIERVARGAFEEKGYALALVSCERGDPADEPPVAIGCEIDLGERQRLDEVRFEGIRSISRDVVRGVVRSRVGRFSSTRLVTRQVEDDLAAIRAVYVREGYLAATARAQQVAGDDRGDVVLVFVIDEGPRYTASSVSLSGNGALAESVLRPLLDLTPGAPIAAAVVRHDRDALHQAYDETGYLAARVAADLVRSERDATVAVTYRIEEGIARRVRQIRIEGLRRTHAGIIRRGLRLKTDQPVSYDRIIRSQRALYDLGIFQSVEITPVPVEGEEGLSDVVVRVEETKPFRLQTGGGVDTEQGIRGLLELSDLNFMGRARLLSLQLRGAAGGRRAQVFLREPRTFGSRIQSLVSALYELRDEVSFTREDRALRFDLWRTLDRAERTRALLRYGLIDTDLHDLKITELEAGAESIRISSLALTLVHDRRDDVLVPRRGMLLSSDLNWASSAIGSQADFLKLTLRGYHYLSLRPRLVWAMAAQLGLGFPRGQSSSLPISERYFAGGATTLRGFGFNQAGPRDPETDEPTGGDAVLVLNQELRYDLLSRLVLTAFVDAGNVYRRPGDIAGSDIRVSAGVGIRYRGPVVAGIDYARLLDRQAGEAAYQIHFSLGFAF